MTGAFLTWERRDIHTGFWWENLNVKGSLNNLDVNGMITLKWISRWRMLSETTFGSEYGAAVPVT